MNKLEQLIKEELSQKTIYLDMDGVICDFDKQTVALLSNDEIIKKFALTPKLSITTSKLNKIGIETREEFYEKLLILRDKCINVNDPFDAYNKGSKNEFGFSVTHNMIRTWGPEFWSTMPWQDGGKELVEFVRSLGISIEILTAGKGSTADIGKKEWLSNNGMGDIPFNIVQRGLDKGEYADINKILIDDKLENIQIFQKSGGLAVHHINTPNTINKLKSMI